MDKVENIAISTPKAVSKKSSLFDPKKKKVDELNERIRVLKASVDQRRDAILASIQPVPEALENVAVPVDSFFYGAGSQLVKDYAGLCNSVRQIQAPEKPVPDINVEADRAYAEEIISRVEHFKNFKVIAFLRRNKTQFSGAVLYKSATHHVVVVFCGSASVKDWLSNAHAGHTVIYGNIFAHRGFVDYINEQLPDIRDGICKIVKSQAEQTTEKRPLTITTAGHSLGGALATLVAYILKHEILPEHNIAACTTIETINFACPRVFTWASADEFEDILGKNQIARICNNGDIIPRLPAELMGYLHVGIEVPLDSIRSDDVDLDKAGVLDNIQALISDANIAKHHFMQTYFDNVNAQYTEQLHQRLIQALNDPQIRQLRRQIDSLREERKNLSQTINTR